MNIEELIAIGREDGLSDIHLTAGLPPQGRKDGALQSIRDLPPLSDGDCAAFAEQLLGPDADRRMAAGEVDHAATLAGVRVRANLYRHQGHTALALRLLNDTIPVLESLGLPPAVSDLPSLQRGIVIVTGETGSGKSTTLAAILQRINETRPDHLLTLEDPIEYVYTPARCLIHQREIGPDTGSYAAGLRAALREDPDVLLIGEMRDLDTIETALTAAETGHLVFATLHTFSAADSIDRIVDAFPSDRQRQIRTQLSMTLQAVLSQQLVPRIGGGRAAACEVMVMTPAIRNLIREGKTPQIVNAMTTSGAQGSVTMDNALLNLYKRRIITAETAREAARDPEYVKKNTMF